MSLTVHGDESDDGEITSSPGSPASSEDLNEALAASMEDDESFAELCLPLPGCMVYPAKFFEGLDFSDYICSVCKDVPQSPQSGCSQHHLLCGNCAVHMQGRNCPECRRPLNAIRDFAFACRKVAKKLDGLNELPVWCDWQCGVYLRCKWTGKGIREYEKHMENCPGVAMQCREREMKAEVDQAIRMRKTAMEELAGEKENSSKCEAIVACLKKDLKAETAHCMSHKAALAAAEATLTEVEVNANRREASLKSEIKASEECIALLRQELNKERTVNRNLNIENQKLKSDMDGWSNWVPLAKRHKNDVRSGRTWWDAPESGHEDEEPAFQYVDQGQSSY